MPFLVIQSRLSVDVFTSIEFLSDSTLPKPYVVHWIDTNSPIWYRRLSDNGMHNEEHVIMVSFFRLSFIVKFSGISSRHIRENSFLRYLNRRRSSRPIMSLTSQFGLHLHYSPSWFQSDFTKFNSDRCRCAYIKPLASTTSFKFCCSHKLPFILCYAWTSTLHLVSEL